MVKEYLVDKLKEDLKEVEAELEYAEGDEKAELNKKAGQLKEAISTLKLPELSKHEKVLQELRSKTPEEVAEMSEAEHRLHFELMNQVLQEEREAKKVATDKTAEGILDQLANERKWQKEFDKLEEKDQAEFEKRFKEKKADNSEYQL